MASIQREQKAGPTVLVFGPQALTLNVLSVQNILHEFRNTLDFQWILETVAGLSDDWHSASQKMPKLRNTDSASHLSKLSKWLVEEEEITKSSFPLPNVVLSPLVVIIQLVQYTIFIKSTLPGFPEGIPLPESITADIETVGLCTGILSAFAVSSSPTMRTLHRHGAASVRLAMLIGAIIDAEERSDVENESVSLSISWNSNHSDTALEEGLRNFPESYISVFMDEKRATVTTRKQTASHLTAQLTNLGLHVTDIALQGRFHWDTRENEMEKIIECCNSRFQLPDASEMVLRSRSNTSGQYLVSGKLHLIALQEILVEQAQWYRTFQNIYSSRLISTDFRVICFGPERCIPPTITRKLDSRLIQPTNNDWKTLPILSQLLQYTSKKPSSYLDDRSIAVIGIACRLPGAEDLQEYTKILKNGKSQHKEVPKSRFIMETVWKDVVDPNRKWYGNFINDYDTFDHKFFQKSPREMASTDPQHRVMLETAYQAVEQSGYFSNSNRTVGVEQQRVGCFLGVGNVDYADNIAGYPANAYSATGNLKSFVAGKISHYFGWSGPSLTIDTACSSSSVAIHFACQAILNGECMSALAGGVNILTSPDWFHNLAGANFLSATGQCKPFDAAGDGYCRGEGAGAVFLKGLSSAIAAGDQVLGVIASTGVYQNRNCTPITVPDSDSLSELFLNVVRRSGLEPCNISVIEAHGTGTPVGDPAEYKAIRKVFHGTDQSASEVTLLTSVKGLIGHTECASGVASLLKVLLMTRDGFIPPQASFCSVNSSLSMTPEDRIEIPMRLHQWDAKFRAALINNYGASGSNASMIVTQPSSKPSLQVVNSLPTNKPYPFWLCGFDHRSLRANVAKFLHFLQDKTTTPQTDLTMDNLSFQVFRQSNRSLAQAFIFTCHDQPDLIRKLSEFINEEKSGLSIDRKPVPRPVILCFGGQISNYVGLDRVVYDSIFIFRKNLDVCDATFVRTGFGSIYPTIFQRTPVQDLDRLHGALFALQYACAKTWIGCGINVTAIVGHSFGELTALCVSNSVSLEHAIKMIMGRALIMQREWIGDKGSMIAIEADLKTINEILDGFNETSQRNKNILSIACHNGPRSFTLAGPTDVTNSFVSFANKDPRFAHISLKELSVTHAFHCPLVSPLRKSLENLSKEIVLSRPDIPLERATEHPITFEENLNSRFLADHLENPVYFSHAVQRLSEKYPSAIWLEAGSKSTITTMASRALEQPLSKSYYFQPINISMDGSFEPLVEATSMLWKQGIDVTFWAHHPIQTPCYSSVLLPPYQFERSRHWLDLKTQPNIGRNVPDQEPKNRNTEQELTRPLKEHSHQSSSALFEVNTSHKKFINLVAGHIIANTSAVCPGIFQVELVVDALMKVRPEFVNLGVKLELHRMQHYHPLVMNDFLSIRVEGKTNDPHRLVWDWQILSINQKQPSSTVHTSGTIIFREPSDTQAEAQLKDFQRLISSKRCLDVLNCRDANDVLKGRNIYRAFSDVINYTETYRHLNMIVGKQTESAGRITKTHVPNSWIDSILTDCFCQVAGIFVNLMTERSKLTENGIYICDRISKWIRSYEIGSDNQHSGIWDIYAMHHSESDKKYISDIFIFDSQDGSLVEVILGVRYTWVQTEAIRHAISAPSTPGDRLNNTSHTLEQSQFEVPIPRPTLFSNPTALVQMDSKHEVSGNKVVQPDISDTARKIVCNLSGLESDEVQDTSDLVELGIDSLMSMELSREIYTTFQCTLDSTQLLDLTDFRSLVECIRSAMGFDNQEFATGIILSNASETTTTEQPRTNRIMHDMLNSNENSFDAEGYLKTSDILDAFQVAKLATDSFIEKGNLGTYYNEIMPRSTELCIVYIINALEELGCPIRSASPGDNLERVTYLPKHDQFMDLIYGLLSKASLIDINGARITRTSVPLPAGSPEVLLEELLRDEPIHAAEHKLISLTGSRFADCITGKADGLQLIFGSAEGREIISDVYAKSPINRVWIEQAEYFMEKFIVRLGIYNRQEPLRILEMGAGTGGTTVRMLPLLVRLGMPFIYTMTDLSSSLIAAARRRFKKYASYMDFKVLDIEATPDPRLLNTQHVILATNCVHATRNLAISTSNIHKLLRKDGFLLLLEMTEQVPWVDFIFGLLEGWWLFQDSRQHALVSASYWEKTLLSVGYGHIDYTEGKSPESNIQRLIIALASDSRYAGPVPHLTQTTALTDGVPDRQRVLDDYIHQYTKNFVPIKTSKRRLTCPPGRCVLVTGGTGSLGSHIVASIAQLPEVTTVVCLNRPNIKDPIIRQFESFKLRGIPVDTIPVSKLKIIEADTTKPELGLLHDDNYQYLVDNVTDIVHNSWPMSLTRTIHAYRSQFNARKNLITLALDILRHNPADFKLHFQFISSIGVVGKYCNIHSDSLVPEHLLPVDAVLPVGYAEAKFVCERMLERTQQRFKQQFGASIVRISQITGSQANGYWNSTEHFASLLKSSQLLQIIPDLPGTLSWCPVNEVAAILGELLFKDDNQTQVYHIENPSRQSWATMIRTLANELNIPHENIIPFEQWIARVQQFPGTPDENPAIRLIQFFEKDFLRMTCGSLILDTARSREQSDILRNLGVINTETVKNYISNWKKSGFLST